MSISKEAIEALTPEQVEAIVGPVHFQHDHHLCNCHEGALEGGDREAYASQQCRDNYQRGVRARNLRIAALTAASPAIQAAALRDAAEAFATGEWADAFMAGNVTDDVSAVKATDKWLTVRADQLEKDAP